MPKQQIEIRVPEADPRAFEPDDQLTDLPRATGLGGSRRRTLSEERAEAVYYLSVGRGTRLLILCAVVGPPVFITTFLVEGATRPGYSAWRNYVSSLATGEGGWVQIVNFLIWGSLAIAFATGLIRLGLLGPGLVIFLYGGGLLVAGIFVTDPSLGYPPGAAQEHTTHGMIHGLAGLAVFLLNAIAAFVVAARFARDPRQRGWAAYSLVTGLVVLMLFVAATVVSVLDEQGVWPNAPTGLLQRISIIVGWTWIAAFAFQLWRDRVPVTSART